MKTEFIPYEEALALKELGFDEPCLRVGNPHGHTMWKWIEVDGDPPSVSIDDVVQVSYGEEWTQIPMFSQAFRFLREKYNLHFEPYTVDMGAIEYSFQIRDLYSEKYVYDNFVGAGSSYSGTFNTYEEAELECLKKLIEIAKSK